jgi:hypothetical protein
MNGFDTMGKKMMSRFFRPVDNVVWDLMTGKVGIQTPGGIASLDEDGTGVDINMFEDFGVAMPAFAQNTPVEDIKPGDLIYNDRRVVGWVIDTPNTKRKSFKVIKPDGMEGAWKPPKIKSFGLDLSGAMVLRSLMNTLPEGGLGNLQGMLMPMMMMGGEMGDLGDMLPMLLMSQTGMGGMDPSAGGNMLQTMMMMKMMNGGFGSSNKSKKNFFDRMGE